MRSNRLWYCFFNYSDKSKIIFEGINTTHPCNLQKVTTVRIRKTVQLERPDWRKSVYLHKQIKKRYNSSKSLCMIKPCVGQWWRRLSDSEAKLFDIIGNQEVFVRNDGTENAAYSSYPLFREAASIALSYRQMLIILISSICSIY